MPDNAQQDKDFLLATLQLAEKGQYTCQPNPRVGCLLVKNDVIIGSGWHHIAGQGHAEVNAIADAKKQGHSTIGATAYVSLEPCNFTGKTPPCVDALINAGVSRVVCAGEDPNPKVSGQGIQRLNASGIAASVFRDEEVANQAEWLNRGFFKRMRSGLPWVILKTAASLDGRTADSQGKSQWITGELARHDVHRLRASSDAVLTGSGTQAADNPSLNVRLENIDCQQPYRVLLATKAQLKASDNIVGDDHRMILMSQSSQHLDLDVLDKISVEEINPFDLHAVLKSLAQRQINTVMVEAGATLAGAFLAANLVDELVQYSAPSVIGSDGRGMFDFPTALALSEQKRFRLQHLEQIGDDIKMVYVRSD